MVEIKGFNEAYNNMLEIEAMKKIKKQALYACYFILLHLIAALGIIDFSVCYIHIYL